MQGLTFCLVEQLRDIEVGRRASGLQKYSAGSVENTAQCMLDYKIEHRIGCRTEHNVHCMLELRIESRENIH